MHRITRIRHVLELRHYQKVTETMVDVSLPLEYLKRSKVYGVYNLNNELVGGFLIVMTGELRSLSSLPELEMIPVHIDLWDIAEVNGLWLSPEVRKKFSSIKFWLLVAREVIFSGKKHFIYTYTTRKKKLGDIYASVKPTTLYEGKTTQLAGMDNADYETIQIVSVKNIIVVLFTTPNFFMRRLFGKRKEAQSQRVAA